MCSQKPAYAGNLKHPSALKPSKSGNELADDEARRAQFSLITHTIEQAFHHVRYWQRIQKAVVISCIDNQPHALRFDAELVVHEVHGARVELVQLREIWGPQRVVLVVQTADERD